MTAPRLVARACRLPCASGPSRMFVRAESTAAASASSAFEPALARGVDPAYDEALQYLEAQNAASRARLDALKAKAGASPDAATAARIARLEVDAWVNDPATRRLFHATGGRGHMDRKVMRALAERRWRKEGELDLVMQRVYQLGVVPDLVPDVRPQAALRLDAAIEPGSIQAASKFAAPPALRLQLFHNPVPATEGNPTPEGRYTLLAIDPDAPDHETHAFSQRLHYAKTDIPISVLSGEQDLFTAPGTEALTYEPPAPARGTGKHRLAFVVIHQRPGAEAEANVTPTAPERESFDLRTYLTDRGLNADDVVAATLIRTQWTQEDDAHIDATYRQYRGVPAPVYGKPPKEMRYGYPLSAKAQRAEGVRQAAWDSVLAEMQAFGQGEMPADEGAKA